MKNTRNILVTGGAGYIGSHAVVELMNKGFNPIIADDFRNSNKKVISGIESITGKTPILREVDVANYGQLKSVFEEFDFNGIIHFAAYKAVNESVAEPLKYYGNNILSLINCLQLAEEFKVHNIVFSSSCTVYGEPDGNKIVSETTKTQDASSPYGATKQICERIICDLHKSDSPLRFLNLRYFNPVGAHPSVAIGELPLGKPNNLLPYLTQTAAGLLDELTVFGNDYNTPDGSCIRDFIHVVDLAKAHLKGLEWLDTMENPVLETLNVGTGKGVSVLEIIHTFEEVSNTKLNWKFGPRRSGDIEQIYADTSRVENTIGWKAEKSIHDAVLDAWNWQKKLGNE